MERVRMAASKLQRQHTAVRPAIKDPVAQNAATRLSRITLGTATGVWATQDGNPFVCLIGLLGLAGRPRLNLPAEASAKLTDWLVSYLSICQAELEPAV